MKSFRHWTPRYIKNRLAVVYYQKAHPDYPWLTRSANEFLESYLIKSDIGLEFGSGRSTIWFAKRIGFLTSVEHDAKWAARVRQMLNEAEIKNVDHKLIPKDAENDQGGTAAYTNVTDSFEPNSLDFCLVDGAYRDFCALRVIDKIRPGGILVIDNVNWYLPCDSYAPSSRTFATGPQGPIWKEVEQRLSGWRRIWTSSGVADTAIFIKPCR